MVELAQKLTPQDASRLLNRWRDNPLDYIDEILGVKQVWRLQKEMLDALPRAIKEHKQMFIGSGHALGKDYICASISLWFLHCSIAPKSHPTLSF